MRHAQEMLALQNELDAAGMEAVRLQKLASQIHHHRTASPLVKGKKTSTTYIYLYSTIIFYVN